MFFCALRRIDYRLSRFNVLRDESGAERLNRHKMQSLQDRARHKNFSAPFSLRMLAEDIKSLVNFNHVNLHLHPARPL